MIKAIFKTTLFLVVTKVIVDKVFKQYCVKSDGCCSGSECKKD